MKVMGLDPSTRTGLVLLDTSKDPLWSLSEEIPAPTKFGDRIDRALGISDYALKRLEAYQPDLVVFEGYGYANTNTLAILVEIGTFLRAVVKRSGIEYLEIAPTSLKKFVSGKGNASKELMMLEVYKRWGFTPATNNIADAFGLALIGLHLKGHNIGVPKAHIGALPKLKQAA